MAVAVQKDQIKIEERQKNNKENRKNNWQDLEIGANLNWIACEQKRGSLKDNKK
jgi:hypothetical protein